MHRLANGNKMPIKGFENISIRWHFFHKVSEPRLGIKDYTKDNQLLKMIQVPLEVGATHCSHLVLNIHLVFIKWKLQQFNSWIFILLSLRHIFGRIPPGQFDKKRVDCSSSQIHPSLGYLKWNMVKAPKAQESLSESPCLLRNWRRMFYHRKPTQELILFLLDR